MRYLLDTCDSIRFSIFSTSDSPTPPVTPSHRDLYFLSHFAEQQRTCCSQKRSRRTSFFTIHHIIIRSTKCNNNCRSITNSNFFFSRESFRFPCVVKTLVFRLHLFFLSKFVKICILEHILDLQKSLTQRIQEWHRKLIRD